MTQTSFSRDDREPTTLNGIEPLAIRQTKERIRADGDGPIARPTYRTSVHWNTAYQTSTEVKAGDVLHGDEPLAYGGTGKGATPQELLLAGIGNCLAATYVGGLTAAGIEVRSLRLDVSGQVDFRVAYGVAEGNPGFASIEVAVHVDSDHPRVQLDALFAKLLPTAPIPDTIMRPVPVNVAVHHETTAADPS
jgi:uncharacterized OsmC-like protein